MLIMAMILLVEIKGPFEFQTINHSEKLELFKANKASIIESGNNIFLLIAESQTLTKMDLSGQVLKIFQTEEGSGPKQFGRSTCFFILNDELVVLNNLNNQALYFSKDLDYLKQQRIDHPAHGAKPGLESLWMSLIRAEHLVGRYDKQLHLKDLWFPQGFGHGLKNKRIAFSGKEGLYLVDKVLWAEETYKMAFHAWPLNGQFDEVHPTWDSEGPPCPEEVVGKRKQGSYTPMDAVAAVGNSWQNQEYLIVQVEFLLQKPEDIINGFDFFSLKDGSFLARHLADYEMISSQGPHLYFLKDETLVRANKIRP